MKLFRKILFWCHLAAGVAAGIVILIMSVTGVLLTYEKQIILWADTRNYQIAPPAAGASRLPVETLLARAEESQGAAPMNITLRSDATAPAAVSLAGGRTIYLNPYSGEALGDGSPGVRNFFRTVTNWHRWLGAAGDNRAAGRAITGASNLLFLFIVASGLYLWWPRKWNWAQLRNILWFRRGLPGKARDFNWHNVIGFWCFAPLFIVVLSATVISYPWASNLVYRIFGETPPASNRGPAAAAPRGGAAESRGGAPGSRGSEGGSSRVSVEGLDRLWSVAEQQTSDWKSISLRLPASAEAPAVFTIDSGTGGEPQKRATLTLDRASGEVVRWEPFSSFSPGRRLRSILRFAHTGEVAGIIGQTIAGIVSLGACFLVWTGIALALRRLRAWLSRMKAETAPAPGKLTGAETGD